MGSGGRAVGPQLGYVRALDGMRAVAILMVIAYHDGRLPGGFVGVDLFFALSGFLITSVLLEEWNASGAIRLPRFYGRRLLRLAPALTVLVATLAFATHVLFPELAAANLRGRWAAAALFYVSDFLIAYGREWPLGNVSICWSLAIEEQFYLLWPLGLLALLRTGLSHVRAGGVLLLASVGPAVLREVLVRREAGDPTLWLRIYFAPDTRADTLLVGCALGLLLAGRPPTWPRAGLIATVLGAGTLAWFSATTSIKDMAAHPILLSVTAAASATLLFGVLQGGIVARLLSARPLVWIGRLSYSLYLWHVVGLIVAREYGFAGKAATLIGLASLSYYLVERPFLALKERLSPLSTPPPGPRPRFVAVRVAAGVAVLCAVVGAGYYGVAEVGRAVALLRGGHAAEAGALFQAMLRRDPDRTVALVGFAEAALQQGHLEDAVATYERAIALDPRNANAHNGLGIAYSRRGDLESAFRHLSDAARLSREPTILQNLESVRAALADRRSGQTAR